MKYLILFFLLSVIFFCCTKTNSDLGLPIQETNPNSFSIYLPQTHSKSVEVFGYNTKAQLETINIYSYDSSTGSPVIDSIFVSFNLTQGIYPPPAYNVRYHYQGDPLVGESNYHELFYDDQNRATIDSVTISGINGFPVQHYLYDNNGNTTVQWFVGYPQIPSNYIINEVDTMFIQNGNIITDINYTTTTGTLNHLFARSYSTHINPLYNKTLANSIGCLVVANNFFDLRSNYLPTQFVDQENGSPTITINYLWATDATGSVVSGVGTDAGNGSVLQIYNFSY
jgi:hypothetical protein